jgi:hypothetical protein
MTSDDRTQSGRAFEPDEPDSDSELVVELPPDAPVPDAVEQHQAVVPEADDEPIEIPPDASEADVLDQARAVPIDDEL